MRRTTLAVFLVITLAGGSAGGAYLLGAQDSAAATMAMDAIDEALDPPPRSVESLCITHTDDLVVDQELVSEDNVVLISLHGDITINAPIRTMNGADGTEVDRIAASPGVGKFYIIGESGRHSGDIILLAPQGTITIQSRLQAGHGGDGRDAYQQYNSSIERLEDSGYPADHPVRIYGGFGGFGGNIYLGATDIQTDDGILLPGSGGKGGDATLDGATRIDVAEGGNGGMGGQAYLLDQTFATTLANASAPTWPASSDHWSEPKDLHPFFCEHPVPLGLDEPLPATVMTPNQRTCRGGDGGDATTYGFHDDHADGEGWDESIAGVASGGNGGWGCPGGDGGDAHAVGATGRTGEPGFTGSCSLVGGRDGGPGHDGRTGGWGGHAFGGDGGAGAPGRDLVDSNVPTVWNWLHGWSYDRWVEYPNKGSWPQVHGSVRTAEESWTFPLIGDPAWFRGGDGGDATSEGGNGGTGGAGGDGRDGLDPGKGGLGGIGGLAAGPGSTFGGWGGPGLAANGLYANAESFPGVTGVRGPNGQDGLRDVDC